MHKQLLAFALCVTPLTTLAQGGFSLASGFDYSSGKYGGATSTDILSIPVTAKYETDVLMLKLTVPYLRVTSAGNVVRGFGTVRPSTTTRTSTQSGLGDITASAAYAFYNNAGLLLDAAGIVKFGTASADKGLGTGENDYAAQLDAFYTVDNSTLMVTAGHKYVGAPPGVTVNNIHYGSLGINQRLDAQYSAGVVLDVAQSPTELTPGTRELSLFLSNQLSTDQRLRVYLLKGLSDASPDWGCGLLLTGYF